MKTFHTSIRLCLALSSMVILYSCALFESSQSLAGTSWLLVDNEKEYESPPSLVFEKDNRVNGNDGCNRFFGNYTETNENTLNIQILGSTKIACRNDIYSNALTEKINQASRFRFESDLLILTDSQNNQLTFKRRS